MGEAKRRKALGLESKTIPVADFAIEMFKRHGKGVVSYPGRKSGLPVGYVLESNIQNLAEHDPQKQPLLAMINAYDPETQMVVVTPVNDSDPFGAALNQLAPLDSEVARLRVHREILEQDSSVVYR
jgi:hypothetical protein